MTQAWPLFILGLFGLTTSWAGERPAIEGRNHLVRPQPYRNEPHPDGTEKASAPKKGEPKPQSGQKPAPKPQSSTNGKAPAPAQKLPPRASQRVKTDFDRWHSEINERIERESQSPILADPYSTHSNILDAEIEDLQRREAKREAELKALKKEKNNLKEEKSFLEHCLAQADLATSYPERIPPELIASRGGRRSTQPTSTPFVHIRRLQQELSQRNGGSRLPRIVETARQQMRQAMEAMQSRNIKRDMEEVVSDHFARRTSEAHLLEYADLSKPVLDTTTRQERIVLNGVKEFLEFVKSDYPSANKNRSERHDVILDSLYLESFRLKDDADVSLYYATLDREGQLIAILGTSESQVRELAKSYPEKLYFMGKSEKYSQILKVRIRGAQDVKAVWKAQHRPGEIPWWSIPGGKPQWWDLLEPSQDYTHVEAGALEEDGSGLDLSEDDDAGEKQRALRARLLRELLPGVLTEYEEYQENKAATRFPESCRGPGVIEELSEELSNLTKTIKRLDEVIRQTEIPNVLR